MVILLVLVSQQLHAQFMEYKPLPIIPRIQYSSPSQSTTSSIEEQVLAARKRRLELEILTQQRDLLRNLNSNNPANINSSNLITITLLGVYTTDLKFNPKSEWRKFTSHSSMVVNKATNQVKIYLPDQTMTFDLLNINIDEQEGYSISTLELASDNFISVLNVKKENGLWIIWGNKREDALVVFQSEK